MGVHEVPFEAGGIGFGGPVASAGFMNRDLVERRGWVKEDTYHLGLGLALAQIMPGPLAAQLAIALGNLLARTRRGNTPFLTREREEMMFSYPNPQEVVDRKPL